jgi:ABC-2 type transport system permease protein
MSGFWTVYRRELAGMFLAPLAWILFCLTLVYNGFFFSWYLEGFGGEVNQAISFVLGGSWPFWILAIFLPPLLTMRMISEESRSGLLEFLLTAPVGDVAVIGGKALAATTFLALVWFSIPLQAALVHLLGAPPDWGIVLTAWIGVVLVSAFFCAIGLVASAACRTPVLAAFLAMVVNVIVVFLPQLGRGSTTLPVALRWCLHKLDVMAHFQGSFHTGALDSAHVLFFLAWSAAMLFVAVRLIETRRWL